MDTCYTSSLESAITQYVDIVNGNANVPNIAGTQQLINKEKAINEDLWFASTLPDSWFNMGSPHFTREQLMSGVDMTHLTLMEKQADWYPTAIV